MGIFQLNKSEGSSAFELLPIGEYECVITKLELTKAQTSGNDMIKVELTIRDDGTNTTGGKRKLFDNLTFTEKAMFKIHQVLAALDIEDGKDYGSYDEIMKDLAYKYIRVKIKHEVDNRDNVTKREKVAFYKPSEHPGQYTAPAGADPFGDSAPAMTISEDDLPF